MPAAVELEESTALPYRSDGSMDGLCADSDNDWALRMARRTPGFSGRVQPGTESELVYSLAAGDTPAHSSVEARRCGDLPATSSPKWGLQDIATDPDNVRSRGQPCRPWFL